MATEAYEGRGFDPRWQLEFARLQVSPVFYGRGVPRGDGRAVMLIPGLFAGDASLSTLYLWLRRIGYKPQRARLVFNADCWQRVFERLERRLGEIAERQDRRVTIIGHSRGGHLARALAHKRPDLVGEVITLGTALVDPHDVNARVRTIIRGLQAYHGATTDRQRRLGCLTLTCRCGFFGHLFDPLDEQVRLTSIYSRDDGVVPERACLAADAEPIAVTGSHVGLAWNAQVYGAVARTLATSSCQSAETRL